MADSKISVLTLLNSPDPVNDSIPIISSGTNYRINRNNFLGITGSPVGTTDSQTLTNKVFTSPTISGATLSGTFTGTYTLGGTPTFPATVVTTAGSQTLTNKTLTSPTITAPTITNASITADSITGFTVANSGSIFGVAVSGGVLGTNTVPTAALQNASVTASKLSTGAGASPLVTASEGTTSTTYTDLTTTTDTVTVTIGANGLALVMLAAAIYESSSNTSAWASFVVSGANTQAASDVFAIRTKAQATNDIVSSRPFLLTGLAAGSTTFKMKYRCDSGITGTFYNRQIIVIPL